MDTVRIFDIRVDKRIRVSDRVALSVLFDVYNVLNSNTVIQSIHSTGLTTINESTINGGTPVRVPSFLSPTTILPPRIARISARLSW